MNFWYIIKVYSVIINAWDKKEGDREREKEAMLNKKKWNKCEEERRAIGKNYDYNIK
jgi:hypothetical protein